jgi:hypothetical protein
MSKSSCRNAACQSTTEAAQDILVGIELMHIMKKRQILVEARAEGLTAAAQFYSLAA